MHGLRVSHILTPVDLGHSSEAALRCAHTLVTALGAKLTLLYVNDALTLQSYDEIYTGYRDLPDEQQEMMEDAVRQWAHPIIGSARYDVLVVADDPVRGIATAAGRHDADLVVMGTHCRHGWQRLLGGSIAEEVLHHTDRPIITVPQTCSQAEMKHIVCPVNFTEVAQRAAHAACCMSSALDAQLHMLHVAEHSVPNLEGAIRGWIGPMFRRECDVREVITHGADIAGSIVEYAAGVDANVIVVGAHRRKPGASRATTGTTTERIMRLSPTAVMSVVRPIATETIEAA